MKKFFIYSVLIIGAMLFSGCSKDRSLKDIRSYKMLLIPDKELAKDYCYRYKGVITINDDYVFGKLQNDIKPTVYINGKFYRKTNEITVEFGEYKKVIGVLVGTLTDEEGSGTWESVNCYGKWEAYRDD